jgi:SAM-dependent methyltransferase
VLSETRAASAYYLQNFSLPVGWLDDGRCSATIQVEVLFYGTANAIRRQALPPLHEHFAGRDQRRLRLIDVGCGTGRFLDFCKQVWPHLPVLGLDMSEAYIDEARRHLKRWCWLNLMVAKGEAIPLADASQTRSQHLHVPRAAPKVRRIVFGDSPACARRSPGGRHPADRR